jgi:hypothetical protein
VLDAHGYVLVTGQLLLDPMVLQPALELLQLDLQLESDL